MPVDSSTATGRSPDVEGSVVNTSFLAICRGIRHPRTSVGRCGCGRNHRSEREVPAVSQGASTASCGRSDTNGSLEPQELAGRARERSAKRNVRLLELLVLRGGVDHLVE